MNAFVGDLVIGCDIALGVLRHGHYPSHPLRHLGLHSCEGIPSSFAQPLDPCPSVFDLESSIDGDGVMDRRQDRQEALDAEQTPAEGLVVVNQIKLVVARS